MFSKLDFQNVREADALMHFLRTDHPIRMVIATDVPYFNLETLVLAQQVDWEALSTIEIDQVVTTLRMVAPRTTRRRSCAAQTLS